MNAGDPYLIACRYSLRKFALSSADYVNATEDIDSDVFNKMGEAYDRLKYILSGGRRTRRALNFPEWENMFFELCGLISRVEYRPIKKIKEKHIAKFIKYLNIISTYIVTGVYLHD